MVWGKLEKKLGGDVHELGCPLGQAVDSVVELDSSCRKLHMVWYGLSCFSGTTGQGKYLDTSARQSPCNPSSVLMHPKKPPDNQARLPGGKNKKGTNSSHPADTRQPITTWPNPAQPDHNPLLALYAIAKHHHKTGVFTHICLGNCSPLTTCRIYCMARSEKEVGQA